MTSKSLDPLTVEDRLEGKEEPEHEKTGTEAELNLDSRVPVKVLRGHTDAVTAVQFCFDGRCILSCSSDHSAILWDVGSCRPLRMFNGIHGKTITECALIPNSNRIITVSWDKKMVAWDLETGQILWQSRQVGLLTSCSISSDSQLVVCAVEPQTSIYISDAASGQTLHHINNHHRSTITRCRFDPQSQRVATVSADRSIKLWDQRAKKTTLSINSNHGNVVSDCCYTNNGHFLCTASWDKMLKLWDLHTGVFRSHGGTSLQRGHLGSETCWCPAPTTGQLLCGICRPSARL
ncbi:hypothetical protein Q8A73_002692 [Channa argus]|nr:hypothetical protein Q8A73_002692 [Channa argus]